MYMTFFDSKRYFSADKFQDFYKTRQFFVVTTPEQEKKYEEVFHQQSVRYSCDIKGNIFEERFEELDGKGLVFRHHLLTKENYASFLSELLSFYGFSFGGVLRNPPLRPLEELIQKILLQDYHFTYEQNTLVYRKDKTEFYLALTEFKDYNFAFRIFERADYDESYKEELIHTLRFLLMPIMAS